MAQSKRELPTGRAHTKVSGDDEMLRTGFYDGTPLEGGKIADSKPVDLFAAAHRVADAAPADAQQQQQQQGTTDNKNIIAESEPVDLPASARGVAEANNPAAATAEQQAEQDVAGGPAAGGRRLGLGRPAY